MKILFLITVFFNVISPVWTQSLGSRFKDIKVQVAKMIYYNFYDGIQMIEVDHVSAWRAKINYLYQTQPPRNGVWEMDYPAPVNSYIFRDKNGKILHQFNVFGKLYKQSDFVSPKKKIRTVNHLNRGINLVPNYYVGRYGISTNLKEDNCKYKIYVTQDRFGPKGLIDTLGNIILEPKYSRISFVDSTYYLSLNGKMEVTDSNFKTIIAAKYEECYQFRDSLFQVKLHGKYGVIDKSGREIIPLKYGHGFVAMQNGIYRNSKHRKWGLVNIKGKEISEFKYSDIRPFSAGFARVKRDGKWGMVNSEGKEVIRCNYDYVGRFKGGKALVQLNGRTFYIDKEGREIKSTTNQ